VLGELLEQIVAKEEKKFAEWRTQFRAKCANDRRRITERTWKSKANTALIREKLKQIEASLKEQK